MLQEEYELLNPLPRWCYSDSEFADMALSADKINKDYLYAKIIEEIVDEDDIIYRILDGTYRSKD